MFPAPANSKYHEPGPVYPVYTSEFPLTEQGTVGYKAEGRGGGRGRFLSPATREWRRGIAGVGGTGRGSQPPICSFSSETLRYRASVLAVPALPNPPPADNGRGGSEAAPSARSRRRDSAGLATPRRLEEPAPRILLPPAATGHFPSPFSHRQ